MILSFAYLQIWFFSSTGRRAATSSEGHQIVGHHRPGADGCSLSPISQDELGAAVWGVPSPLPTGSRCPRSDAGKCYPSGPPHTPHPNPRQLSAAVGQGSGAPEWLAPPSHQDQSCPCCSRSWSRLSVRVRRAPGGGLNDDGEEPLDPPGRGLGRDGVAPRWITTAAAEPSLSPLLPAAPWWSIAWTSCCGTRG